MIVSDVIKTDAAIEGHPIHFLGLICLNGRVLLEARIPVTLVRPKNDFSLLAQRRKQTKSEVSCLHQRRKKTKGVVSYPGLSRRKWSKPVDPHESSLSTTFFQDRSRP